MQTFNVYLNRKLIDTVFFSNLKGTIADKQDQVKASLVNHDGYDPEINVKLVGRNTKDEYELQANYKRGGDWECVCTEKTREEAQQRMKKYWKNDLMVCRVVKKRVPVY